MTRSDKSVISAVGGTSALKVVTYYVGVVVAILLARRYWPELYNLLNAQDYGAAVGRLVKVDPAAEVDPGYTSLRTVVALIAASVLLTFPVAWICSLTRSKQGYRQSLVQTLIILPIIVAGVVTLVRNSQALAFGLAGIVAAVGFRNRLEDSKDAVFLFLAIAVGVACGVQAVNIAAAISIMFAFTALVLWRTDFGRVPGALEGGVGEQRLKRAMALANRTHQFVSMVDQEILKSLSPDQLRQVANRIADRQVPGQTLGVVEVVKPPRRLTVIAQDASVRGVLEDALAQHTKRWLFLVATPGEGPGAPVTLRYEVRLRKKVPDAVLLQRLRDAGGERVREVTLAAGDDT